MGQRCLMCVWLCGRDAPLTPPGLKKSHKAHWSGLTVPLSPAGGGCVLGCPTTSTIKKTANWQTWRVYTTRACSPSASVSHVFCTECGCTHHSPPNNLVAGWRQFPGGCSLGSARGATTVVSRFANEGAESTANPLFRGARERIDGRTS